MAVRSGAAIIGIAPLGYLIPTLPSMVATRVVQGVGWAAYGTGGHAVLAKIATPARRSEAAGYYNAMPALAVLIGPTVGLWLYANVSAAGPFLLASALGLAGLLVTRWLPLAPALPPTTPDGRPVARAPVKLVLGLFDPAAIIPMLLIGTFMSVQSLFVIFAPVFASEHGIPIEQLALYYPVYGIVLLVAHLALGRVSDRVGRFPAIVAGCLVAIVGLAIATVVPRSPRPRRRRRPVRGRDRAHLVDRQRPDHGVGAARAHRIGDGHVLGRLPARRVHRRRRVGHGHRRRRLPLAVRRRRRSWSRPRWPSPCARLRGGPRAPTPAGSPRADGGQSGGSTASRVSGANSSSTDSRRRVMPCSAAQRTAVSSSGPVGLDAVAPVAIAEQGGRPPRTRRPATGPSWPACR